MPHIRVNYGDSMYSEHKSEIKSLIRNHLMKRADSLFLNFGTSFGFLAVIYLSTWFIHGVNAPG